MLFFYNGVGNDQKARAGSIERRGGEGEVGRVDRKEGGWGGGDSEGGNREGRLGGGNREGETKRGQ